MLDFGRTMLGGNVRFGWRENQDALVVGFDRLLIPTGHLSNCVATL